MPKYLLTIKTIETESFDVPSINSMGDVCEKTIEITYVKDVEVSIVNSIEEIFPYLWSSSADKETLCNRLLKTLEGKDSYLDDSVSVSIIPD